MDSQLSPEQIEAWIHKHLASAPDRDESWYRSVLNIYQAGSAPEPVEDRAA